MLDAWKRRGRQWIRVNTDLGPRKERAEIRDLCLKLLRVPSVCRAFVVIVTIVIAVAAGSENTPVTFAKYYFAASENKTSIVSRPRIIVTFADFPPILSTFLTLLSTLLRGCGKTKQFLRESRVYRHLRKVNNKIVSKFNRSYFIENEAIITKIDSAQNTSYIL